MTIANGYLAKSAQLGGIAFSGHTVFGLSENGRPIQLKSDGERYNKVTPIIPDNTIVEIETRDLGHAAAIGTSGAMSCVADKMVGGITLTGTLTFAAASTTILSVNRGYDIEGNAISRVTAVINSPDGAVSGLGITSA